jgi:hypothetical protein
MVVSSFRGALHQTSSVHILSADGCQLGSSDGLDARLEEKFHFFCGYASKALVAEVRV